MAQEPCQFPRFGPIIAIWSINHETPTKKPWSARVTHSARSDKLPLVINASSLSQFMDVRSKLNKNTMTQFMSSLTDNEYVAKAIYILATIAGVIVGVSQFIYTSWVENNMTTKTKTFIISTLNVLDSGSNYIRNELTETDKNWEASLNPWESHQLFFLFSPQLRHWFCRL